jgi:hypothetical protein
MLLGLEQELVDTNENLLDNEVLDLLVIATEDEINQESILEEVGVQRLSFNLFYGLVVQRIGHTPAKGVIRVRFPARPI